MTLRILALPALALFAAVASAANPTPAEQQLRQQLQNAEKQIAALQAQLNKAKASDNTEDKMIMQLKQQVAQLQNDLKAAKGNDTSDSKTIKTVQTQLDSIRKARFVHTIVYKAKTETEKAEMQSLADDANLFFISAKSVRAVWAGKASADVGSSAEYQAVIVLLFDDAAGLQSFQKDPQWKRFTDKHAKLWEDPKFYDAQLGK